MKNTVDSDALLQLLVDVEAMIDYANDDESLSCLQEIANKLTEILGIEEAELLDIQIELEDDEGN
jgi:tRNA U34 5-carboxymethylaminomethyl modifying GTPase MnmE/TrmE